MIAILLVSALLGQAVVRLEAKGVRVGDELVISKDPVLRGVGRVPVLVSADSVENQGTKGLQLEVAIAAGDRRVTIAPAVRLTRLEKGYRLSVGQGRLIVQSGGREIEAAAPLEFTLSEKGFKFGESGTLDGPSFSVKVLAAP